MYVIALGFQVVSAEVKLEPSSLQHVFELDRCIAAINDHGFKQARMASNAAYHNSRLTAHCLQVGLQFPDDLLPYASTLYQRLADATQASLFIMGDTSYGRYPSLISQLTLLATLLT